VKVRVRCASAALLLALVGATASAEIRFPGPLPLPAGKEGFRLDSPVRLSAETLSYDEQTGVAVAEGKVELALGNRTMRADRIRYDSTTGEADLSGKVHYKDADEEFAFDRITINLDSETGVLYNGTIRIATNSYLISSEKLEKTGKQSFLIEKGVLTTCPCDPEPDWKFEVRKARVVLDEYAKAKDITFRIRGVPVLWLPYGAFPVKLTRQSGLLMPSFSSGKSTGYTLSLPLYWAINRWSDATITMDAMSKRGYRPEIEYRFSLNRESEGAVRGTIFHDKATDDSRWRLYGENVYRSGAWTANGKLELPSDDRYYLDLVDADFLRSARTARSTGFVGRTTENTAQEAHVTWNRDLQELPVDNTVQRLPEYTLTILPRSTPFEGVEFSGEFAGTRFHRKDAPEELRGRGAAGISRTFGLHPSIHLAPFLFVDALADRRDASPGGSRDSGRVVPGAGANLTVDARKDYGGSVGPRVHAVRTSLGYRYVPKVRQDDIPLTDQWSRLAPQSQFALTVSQRLLGLDNGTSPRELASLTLEWAYDPSGKESARTPYVDPLSPFVRTFRDQIDTVAGRPSRGTEAFSDVYANLLLAPSGAWKFRGETLFDPVYARVILGAVSGEWRRDDDNRVLAEYRISRDLAEDVHGLAFWRPFRFLRLQGQTNYSIRNRALIDGSAGLTLFPRSDCWTLGFVAERKSNPTDTTLKLTFGLKGIGSIGK
jgi:LPS-assembly protein